MNRRNDGVLYRCLQIPRKFGEDSLWILSFIHLLCGTAAIILFGIALTKGGYLYQVGTGMWSGSLMLSAGCLGLITCRHKSACTMISLLVICVMSSVTSAILAALSTAGLVNDGVLRNHITKFPLTVLHTLLFIVGFLECSVSIVTAIVCGRQVCCGAIYLPGNFENARDARAWMMRNRPYSSSNSRSDAGMAAFASLLQAPSSTALSNLLRRNNAPPLPVLTTNTFHSRLLFPDQEHPPTSTSLVYLLSPTHPNTSDPTFIFPPFPPSYSAAESRPLSAYACINTTTDSAADTLLQPALFVTQEPPPYSSSSSVPIAKISESSSIIDSVNDNTHQFTSRLDDNPRHSSRSKPSDVEGVNSELEDCSSDLRFVVAAQSRISTFMKDDDEEDDEPIVLTQNTSTSLSSLSQNLAHSSSFSSSSSNTIQ